MLPSNDDALMVPELVKSSDAPLPTAIAALVFVPLPRVSNVTETPPDKSEKDGCVKLTVPSVLMEVIHICDTAVWENTPPNVDGLGGGTGRVVG